MADGGDGRLRTSGSGGDGGAGESAGGGMLLYVVLLVLVLLAAYLLYLRWRKRSGPGGAAQQSQAALLPRMKRRDFSLEQLHEFDGTRNPRILLAVNGKVFDVTKGSKFYGPGERREGRGRWERLGRARGSRGGGGPGAARSALPGPAVPCRDTPPHGWFFQRPEDARLRCFNRFSLFPPVGLPRAAERRFLPSSCYSSGRSKASWLLT